MPLVCQAPSCEHQFEEDFSGDTLVAESELPIYTHVYPVGVAPGEIGTRTVYFCTESCLREYLESDA